MDRVIYGHGVLGLSGNRVVFGQGGLWTRSGRRIPMLCIPVFIS